MYFWNTKKLANKIRDNEITETEKKNYYLAGAVLLYMSMYSMWLQPRNNFTLLAIEAALMVLVAVVGINCTFKSNGGSSGKDYVSRMAVISFPISIKLFLTSFLVGALIGLFMAILSLPESAFDLVASAATVLFQCLILWRINVAIKYINT